MKTKDISFLLSRIHDFAKSKVAPVLAEMPDEDNSVIFAEAIAILCFRTFAKVLAESTPKTRAAAVRRWMKQGERLARKETQKAGKGKAERKAKK